MKLTQFDYEYLTGTWVGARGAAFNVVSEDCRSVGYGDYGKPTKTGERAIGQYEEDQLNNAR